MKLKGLKVGIDVGLPMLLAVVCVATATYFAFAYVPRERESAIERWRGELESRADGRKAAIELWVANGLADAQGLASFPSLFRLLSHSGALTTSASADRAHMDEILARLASAEGRLGSYAIDRSLRVVARDARLREIDPGCLDVARAVLASGAASSDFHRHSDAGVVVTFAVPVREAPGDAPVGVVVVIEDPSRWLYPYVGIGPATANSTETVLVKRDGDDALFLSPLRDNPAPPLTFRHPLSLPGFAAQEALGGHERFGAFRDYRDVLVLAATRLIRHANWGLVTKIDRDEALAPWHSRMWRDGLTDGGLLLALVGLALLFWRAEHRSSAETLRAISLRQQALLAAIPDIVMEVDADEVYRWANPAGLAFFGEDVIGKEASHYYEGEQDTYEKVQPLFQGEERVIYVESWQRRRDGAKRLLAWWCQLLKDDAGRVMGAISSGRDITERKRAETALRESEERFRSLYENTSVGLYQTTPDGRILMANPTALRLLGFASLEELAQRNLEKDGFEPAYARRDFRERLERDGKIVGLESVWNRRDGTVIYVRESATVVRDENGQALHYDGTFEDVTDRRRAEQALIESEERYRLLVDQAPYAIGVQQEGRVIFANPAAVRLFGATSAEDLIGKTIATLVHPEDWPATQERVARMLAGEGGLFPTENRYLRLDGREVPVEVFASPFTHAGRPAVQVIAIDTTQRKRLEEELRQSQKMEAIGRLAGGVAHDFNNLLSVILGYGSLLAQELPAEGPARKKMDEILRASERAAGLTRQLLAFSRRQAVQPVRLDINTVLMDVEKMLRRLIGEDVELIASCAPDLWPVFADAGQIVQVLMNLAVNARDAMPTGGKLSIETRNVDLAPSAGAERHGPHVALIVSDTGHGMDRETLARLFEPFFTTKELGKGTGLGLATVHGIVQQNNGHIEVESEPGRGSTFTVYLPRLQGPVAAPAPERRAPVWEPELRGSESILLVEDEEGLGVVISELLGTAGYKVVHAKDPVEALAHVRQQRPAFDVLLTDVIMPQMNGRDLALKVRAIQSKIKAIFMSGYAEDALGTVLAADVAFLQKPFTQAALLRKLREVLAGPGPSP